MSADTMHLANRDGNYIRLFAGEDTEIQFTLPEDVKPQDVNETQLVVTGYYERYSELLVRRLLNRNANQAVPIKSNLP